MDGVAFALGHGAARFATIAFVQTQMLLRRLRVWSFNWHSLQRRFQQAPVRRIGSADHDAERHALPIHQQVACGARFAPIRRVFVMASNMPYTAQL